MVDDHIKHTFTGQTDMTWSKFREEVVYHFDKPCGEVRIMFRISGEGGAWTDLTSESDWERAVDQLVGKVWSARTRPVSMEVKDEVSCVACSEDIH